MAQAKTRLGGFVAILSLVALLALSASPALAHHKDDHAQGGGSDQSNPSDPKDRSEGDHDGDANSDSSSETKTEDNDTNDNNTPNNVEDDGDNAHPSGKDRSVENSKSTKNPNQGKAESNPDDSKGPQRFEGGRGDDKPDGPGGNDLADQDGNNGCGNDDDFDDDNNGWCGKNRPTSPPNNEVGGSGGGGGQFCPTNPSLPLGHEDCNPVGGSGFKICPAGTDFAGFPMLDLNDCNQDEVEGRTDQSNPNKFCPAGTDFAGMPFFSRDECDFKETAVSPSRIVRGAVARNAPATQGAAQAAGGALPFTGAGELLALAGLALTMIAGGAAATRMRGHK